MFLADVSRETLGDLERFVELLSAWNPRLNLVSRDDIGQVWDRHVADSLQLVRYLPSDGRCLVDMGSGGGFPGIVLSIALRAIQQDMKSVLIEADRRKAEFLRTAVRELRLDARVECKRIEAADFAGADVVTARALAPLGILLGFAARHLKIGGKAVFSKGSRWQEETELAMKDYSFHFRANPSITSNDSVVLEVWDIERG